MMTMINQRKHFAFLLKFCGGDDVIWGKLGQLTGKFVFAVTGVAIGTRQACVAVSVTGIGAFILLVAVAGVAIRASQTCVIDDVSSVRTLIFFTTVAGDRCSCSCSFLLPSN